MGVIKYDDVTYSGGGGGDNSILISQAEYNALPQSEKDDTSKIYYIYDAVVTSAEIDDTTTALDKVWSSAKTSAEINAHSGGAVIDDTAIAADKTWSSSKINAELGDKVDAVSGKGLSTEDYTTNEKSKLAGIEAGAEANVQSDWNQTDDTADDFIKNKPTIPPGVVVDQTYDGTSTNAQSGTAVAQAIDTRATKDVATTSANGLMSSTDKTKLDGIASGAQVNTIESISVNGSSITPDINKNVALTVMTNAVNDLVNYYLKTETYNKTEVDNLISAVATISIEVVSALPTTNIKTNVIYLVPSSDPQTQNVKDEYINLDGTTSGWELIGSTAIDLSGYLKTTDVGTAAFKDVAASGDASATEVVLGSDTRLTDARPASDVSAWAKAANKPTYTATEVGAVDSSTVGVAGGIPSLDSNGKIPTSQIPSLSASDISDIEGLIDD